MKVLFIGCGNMGGAMVAGMIKSNNFDRKDIWALVPQSSHNLPHLKDELAINVIHDLSSNMKFDYVVVAVKPQSLPEIENAILRQLNAVGRVIVSIVVGKPVSYFKQFMPDCAIVRTMPNLNSLAGFGSTTAYSDTELSSEQDKVVGAIFNSIGSFYWLSNEDLIDAVTPISGSGPAYFFQFVEHMAKAGKKMGVPSDLAEKLAIETFIGAAEILRSSGKKPSELREAVTSKGGVTFAALSKFNDDNALEKLTLEAMQACYTRAKELGNS